METTNTEGKFHRCWGLYCKISLFFHEDFSQEFLFRTFRYPMPKKSLSSRYYLIPSFLLWNVFWWFWVLFFEIRSVLFIWGKKLSIMMLTTIFQIIFVVENFVSSRTPFWKLETFWVIKCCCFSPRTFSEIHLQNFSVPQKLPIHFKNCYFSRFREKIKEV